MAQETRQAKFGEMVLVYDAKVWVVHEREARFEARCGGRECAGRVVSGTVTPDSSCDRSPDEAPRETESSDMTSGALRWRVWRWWRGCRNLHPESVAACTIRDGLAYRVEAPLQGCRGTSSPWSADAILGLVRGIVPPER